MAEAVVNQDTEIMAKGPGVFTQAGSLVSQVQRMYSQPAFQRSLPNNGCCDCWHCGISGVYVYAEAGSHHSLCWIA